MLAARRPVLCTPLPIFRDAGEAVTFTSGVGPFEISDSILNLYRDPGMLHAKDEAQNAYVEAHTWKNVVRRLMTEITARLPLAAKTAAAG